MRQRGANIEEGAGSSEWNKAIRPLNVLVTLTVHGYEEFCSEIKLPPFENLL